MDTEKKSKNKKEVNFIVPSLDGNNTYQEKAIKKVQQSPTLRDYTTRVKITKAEYAEFRSLVISQYKTVTGVLGEMVREYIKKYKK